VDEGAVNHAIRLPGSAAQTFQVFQLPAMHFGASGNKRLGTRIGATEPQHLITRAH
jgi:hypothetical protein